MEDKYIELVCPECGSEDWYTEDHSLDVKFCNDCGTYFEYAIPMDLYDYNKGDD